jgi:uncharacterized membrane protein
MVTTLQGTSLLLATLAMGLMAGVFGLYAYAIMPGLGKTDARTFVGAFQAIDRAIINPLFMAMFFGALVLTAVAVALNLGEGAAPWAIAALVLYIAVFAITIAVNVPLNDAIKAAGDPDRISDLARVREQFDESRWAGWNVARAAACTAAFGSLLWALIEFGRTL